MRIIVIGNVITVDMNNSESKGLRYNEGKLRYDLIPWEWEYELAEVLGMGAKKYADRNWELGMDWSICVAALRRHLKAFQMGESVDPESGRPHLAHVAWNALALMSYDQWKVGNDNRPKH